MKKKEVFFGQAVYFADIFLDSETDTSTLESLELLLGNQMKVSAQPEPIRGLG